MPKCLSCKEAFGIFELKEGICKSCRNQEGKTVSTVEPPAPSKKKNPAALARGIFSLVIAAGAVWYFFGGGLQKQAAKDMDRIKQQVAADSITQYQIAKRSGTKIDACVHAGLVSAAYLQANDEGNYRQWKQIETADCRAAGMPQ